MNAILLEFDESANRFVGASGEVVVSLIRSITVPCRCFGHTLSGTPVFEWTEDDLSSALQRLGRQEDCTRVVLYQRSHDFCHVEHVAPDVEDHEGVRLTEVTLPLFGGDLGELVQSMPGPVSLSANSILSVEYLRVGSRTGSVIVVREDSMEEIWLVSVEPDAVLNQIFNVSPEIAKRIAPDRFEEDR